MAVPPCVKIWTLIVIVQLKLISGRNRVGDVMVRVLSSSAIDSRLESRLDQTKDSKICNCCFSAEHAALKRKSKYLLAENLDNVSEWGDMSISFLLFQ